MKPSPETLPTRDLLLDRENPRFSASERGQSQEFALRVLVERFKLDELADSILSSGFLTFDPLVGYRSESGSNSSVVIREGNRRVATLKLLLDPAQAPERHRKPWREFARAQRTTPGLRQQIESVSVLVFDDKEQTDLSAYVGFRHVTGVLKWPAFEKAAYIADLVNRQKWSFKDVAQRLGSYPKHVERYYIAHQVVRQAHDAGVDGAEQMEGRFGVLLRALNSPGVNNLLGLTYPGKPQQAPVKADQESYAHFVKWTFGTEAAEPVVRDSRQLSQWGQILESPEARRYLRNADEPKFDRAWLKCGGQARSIVNSLHVAADRLEEVVALVSEHKDADEIKNAVAECGRFLSQILQHFPEVDKKYFSPND